MATQRELAAHLGISERQVRRHVTNGVIPKAEGRGNYDLDHCRLSYIDYLRELAAGREAEPSSEFAEQRARVMRLRAEKLEQELAVSRREYLPISLFGEIITRATVPLVSQFDTFAARVNQHFPKVSSNDRRRIIEFLKELRHALADTKMDWDSPIEELSL